MRTHRRNVVTGILASVLGGAGIARAQSTGTPAPVPNPPALGLNGKPLVNPNAPPPPGFYDYSGVTGPGKPAEAYSEHGGWRSGASGVAYSGPNTQGFKPNEWKDYAKGTAVTAGMLPPIRPLIEAHVRDTVITLGGDGNYYMTGSTGDNIWAFNDGVELWRSPDLKKWDYMGVVWSIEKDGGWEKAWRGMHDLPTRAIWAPEIHYVGGTYAIALSMAPGGLSILKSSTGKPEGPYVHAFSPDKPLMNGIDGTLFQDDDGSIYFTYGGGRRIFKLKADWSGFDGDPHEITFDEDHDPAHHGPRCPNNNFNDIGREGAVLFKANGKYYLGAADWPQGRYSSMLVMSDTIYGPYHKRHEAVPCGGGTGFFKDKQLSLSLVVQIIPAHSVQDRDELSGDGENSDLSRLSGLLQSLSHGFESWVASARDESGKVQCAPDIASAAPDVALATPMSGIIGLRRQAGQAGLAGNGASVDMPQFR